MILETDKITVDFFHAYEADIDIDGLTQKDKVLPYLSIVHPACGSYRVRIEDDPLQFLDSGCFIVPPNTRHTIIHYNSPETGCIRPKWCFLRVLYNRSIDLMQFILPPLVAPDKYAPDLVSAILSLLELEKCEPNEKNCFKRIELASKVISILFEISEFTLNSSKAIKLFPALRMIESHYPEQITLEMMSEACKMGRTAFVKQFGEIMGTSPGDYLIKQRLLKAMPMILENRTLGEIASAVGFCDEFHLGRTFKAKYGISPGQYKKYEFLLS